MDATRSTRRAVGTAAPWQASGFRHRPIPQTPERWYRNVQRRRWVTSCQRTVAPWLLELRPSRQLRSRLSPAIHRRMAMERSSRNPVGVLSSPVWGPQCWRCLMGLRARTGDAAELLLPYAQTTCGTGWPSQSSDPPIQANLRYERPKIWNAGAGVDAG